MKLEKNNGSIFYISIDEKSVPLIIEVNDIVICKNNNEPIEIKITNKNGINLVGSIVNGDCDETIEFEVENIFSVNKTSRRYK
jgi:hypothetical protein